MACPTCDHTLGCVIGQSLTNPAIFSCERCGTLVVKCDAGDNTIYRPKLVDRVRAFETLMLGNGVLAVADLIPSWRRLGIAESINPPNLKGTNQ